MESAEEKQRELNNEAPQKTEVADRQTPKITEKKLQDQLQSSESAIITKSEPQVTKLQVAQFLESEENIREKNSQEKPSGSPYSSTGLFAAAVAGVVAIGAGIRFNRSLQEARKLAEEMRIEQETRELAEEMKNPLIPINEYIARYQLLEIEEIKSLEWKLSSQSLVLEMKSQPQALQNEIERIFKKDQFRDFVKITDETVTEAIDGKEIEVNKKTISLDLGSLTKNQQKDRFISSIKDSLNHIGIRKNNELETNEHYQTLLDDSIDPMNEALTSSLVKDYVLGGKLNGLKFQRLLYMGRVTFAEVTRNMCGFSTESDLSLNREDIFFLKELEEDDNETFLAGELEKDPWEKWKKIVKSRDVIGREFKVGTRIGADDKSYLVRFPKNKDDSRCLGMTIENREPKFFELIKNNLGQLIPGPAIDLDKAKDFLRQISLPNAQVANPALGRGRGAGNPGGERGRGRG